jgi:hypothetical protein
MGKPIKAFHVSRTEEPFNIMQRIDGTHFERGIQGRPPPGSGDQPLQGGDMVCGIESEKCSTLSIIRKVLHGPLQGKEVALTNAHFDRV